MTWRIICGDCLEVMAEMDDNSVNLIATDPPYYRVKGDWWDRQWDTADGFIEWIGRLCEQWQRILVPNGSLYVFASPKMAARVEVELGQWFNVLNRIVWTKPAFSTKAEMNPKAWQRQYFPVTEYLFFAEHHGADNWAKGEGGYQHKCDELRGFVFEPLRAYLDGERRRAGLSDHEMRAYLGLSLKGGGLLAHYWGRAQWMLPTEEHYYKLRELWNARCNHGGEYLRREYEDLRREYEDLRREYEDLRRPFSVTADVPYTDVWDFPTVQAYPGKHPCEKPLAMMEHIVRTSSREGDTVLDCFMGSGNTGRAAMGLGRSFVGIEISEHWCSVARQRLLQPRQIAMEV